MNDSLVSIGIPTYNRPDGLLNVIKKITSQSYKNIEIIISNNASDNELVSKIIEYCASLDKRIKFYHQQNNIGATKNFKFVLGKASGEFFMWAADDDDWEPDFIDCCLKLHELSHVGLTMTGFYRFDRKLNLSSPAMLHKLTGVDRYLDATNFMSTMQHSIIYGLHRRSTIEWFLDNSVEEFDDEYFLIKQILNCGVITDPTLVKYGAGIDATGYKIKANQVAEDRYFNQVERIIPFATLLTQVDSISDAQKIDLFRQILIMKLNFVSIFEKNLRSPEQYDLALKLKLMLSNLNLLR